MQKQITREQLKERREALGFRMSGFAKHCRIPYKTYQQYEYGVRRIPATIIVILETLEKEQNK